MNARRETYLRIAANCGLSCVDAHAISSSRSYKKIDFLFEEKNHNTMWHGMPLLVAVFTSAASTPTPLGGTRLYGGVHDHGDGCLRKQPTSLRLYHLYAGSSKEGPC